MSHSNRSAAIARPQHGGSLHAMSVKYSIPLEQWLDLSTGINPHPFSVTKVPASAWSDLPDHDGLQATAQSYYQCRDLLMVPGSQWAISVLPRLFQDLTDGEDGRVLLPAQGYREHAYAWLQAGYELVFYQGLPSDDQLKSCDVCVVINPNNPTGEQLAREQVEDIYEACREHGALLVVDEAFIDLEPEQSMCALAGLPNLIVLRSLGKFFGLAGIRVGAICAWAPMLAALESYLPPWSLAGPSRYAAGRALADTDWIARTQEKLAKQGKKLSKILHAVFEKKGVGTDLFQTIYLESGELGGAKYWFEGLASQGIAVRLLDEEDGLRFGLPGAPKEWKRFEVALTELRNGLAERSETPEPKSDKPGKNDEKSKKPRKGKPKHSHQSAEEISEDSSKESTKENAIEAVIESAIEAPNESAEENSAEISVESSGEDSGENTKENSKKAAKQSPKKAPKKATKKNGNNSEAAEIV